MRARFLKHVVILPGVTHERDGGQLTLLTVVGS
jgi:hypothetical protein